MNIHDLIPKLQQYADSLQDENIVIKNRLKSLEETDVSKIAKILHHDGYITDDIPASVSSVLDSLKESNKVVGILRNDNRKLKCKVDAQFKEIEQERAANRELNADITEYRERLNLALNDKDRAEARLDPMVSADIHQTNQQLVSRLNISDKAFNSILKLLSDNGYSEYSALCNIQDLINTKKRLQACNSVHCDTIDGLRAKLKEAESEPDDRIGTGDYFVVSDSVNPKAMLCTKIITGDNGFRQAWCDGAGWSCNRLRKATWSEVFPKGQRITVKYHDGTMAGIIKEAPKKDSTSGTIEALVEFYNKSIEWVTMDSLIRRT